MVGELSVPGIFSPLLARRLFGSWVVDLPDPPARVLAQLAAQVAPLEGGFTLVSRVSWGGAVTRALRDTGSELPLFGQCTADGFKIAALPRGPDVSPFQPILDGTITALDGGCRVSVEMAPHPGARTFAGLFVLGGGMLLVAAALRVGEAPGMALALTLFAVTFFVFPTLRARIGFAQGCEMSVSVLRGALGLS
jgi:hypothetical protein